ncbi:hypothetical protein SDC9_196451 [bioreactor metagenome]|uniref:Uncharacterized protein n=1 Tax=bioreactor metagenome TaxID=1076179 RepID=A0A645IEG1_9ZZZZ
MEGFQRSPQSGIGNPLDVGRCDRRIHNRNSNQLQTQPGPIPCTNLCSIARAVPWSNIGNVQLCLRNDCSGNSNERNTPDNNHSNGHASCLQD